MNAMNQNHLITTGIPGMDEILCGGLVPNGLYLLQGTPGAGKTTFAIQFMLEGVRKGEKVLYITLSETKKELISTSASHGWSLEGIEILELFEREPELEIENQFIMFEPSEVELNVTTKTILEKIEQSRPHRVVIDSLAEINLLAQNALRYRRQILAIKQFLYARQCIAVLIDDNRSEDKDHLPILSVVHGIIRLEQFLPEYGRERRKLSVIKLRGQHYYGGYHDFIIRKEGLIIFPRLISPKSKPSITPWQLKSGLAEFDKLLGGCIDSGTNVLLIGPAGTGKSSLSLQYAITAAASGKRCAMFVFDEQPQTIFRRAAGMGLKLKEYVENGLITIQPLDPVERSPGEFMSMVKKEAEGNNSNAPAKVIIIDTLNGYLNAMPAENFLISQLHELLSYLARLNVITFLIVAQHGVFGNIKQTPLDTSYLADTVILFRYFELRGQVKQAVSVFKKRSGYHEHTIREFRITNVGIKVGSPLKKFQGVLTGQPIIVNDQKLKENA
jgi:circadian clock protein KaiC